jgi:23S rRNA pseudouridine1911/1915/1917 synthase
MTTERLDRFLADQLALSRTQVARLVAGGAVLLNDKPARASRTLERGDLLSVELKEFGGRAPREIQGYDFPLDVVHEDDTLLVLNKPAGLVVHPAPGHWEDTLVNALAARGTGLSGGAEGRPGIVHRLDKDTSGLIVLAKTDATHRKLARALSGRRIQRVYVALTWGHLEGALDIDAAVARHPRDRKRMAVLATGRQALTHVTPVARFELCDLVRINLGTGRTHQIRVHLSHIGHPVVGDPVYGGGGYKRMTGAQKGRAATLERAAPRQALHAALLSLTHPESGEPVQFVAGWPHDLCDVLEVAGGDPTLLDRDNLLKYLGFAQ